MRTELENEMKELWGTLLRWREGAIPDSALCSRLVSWGLEMQHTRAGAGWPQNEADDLAVTMLECAAQLRERRNLWNTP